MKGDRRQRHLKILELISTHAIPTQGELAEALAREGWEVTQSSVSRDIAALHLVKVDGAYQRVTQAQRPRHDPDEQRIADGVLTLEPAGDALIVLHTPPGEANRVGAALDRLAWPDVLGNISGDDTIFVAVRDPGARRRVMSAIRKLGGTMACILSFLAGAGMIWAQQQGATRREPQFENEHLKVWKSVIMPNQPLAMHRHEHGRALIALVGGQLTVVGTDGKPVGKYDWESGKAYWLDPDPPGQMHADVNETSHPIEVIVVELKQDR